MLARYHQHQNRTHDCIEKCFNKCDQDCSSPRVFLFGQWSECPAPVWNIMAVSTIRRLERLSLFSLRLRLVAKLIILLAKSSVEAFCELSEFFNCWSVSRFDFISQCVVSPYHVLVFSMFWKLWMVTHPHGEYSSREFHLGRLAGMPHKALILIRTVCYTTEKMLSALKLYQNLIHLGLK